MSQILALSRLSKIKLCSLYLREFQQLLDINLAIDILNKKVNLLGRLLYVAADIENLKQRTSFANQYIQGSDLCFVTILCIERTAGVSAEANIHDMEKISLLYPFSFFNVIYSLLIGKI